MSVTASVLSSPTLDCTHSLGPRLRLARSLLTLGDEASPPEPGSLMLRDREGGVTVRAKDSVFPPEVTEAGDTGARPRM